MAWYWGLMERLRNLLRRGSAEREMEEEFRFHLEKAVEKNLQRGMPPEKAYREAILAFGGVERMKERTRNEQGIQFFLDLGKDLRHAIRSLGRRPGFAIVAILTLALCIGANSAIFSIVNSIILSPLPYPDSDRLVYVFNSYPGANVERAGNSITSYLDRRDFIEAFEEVALYSIGGGIIGEGESSRHAFSMSVTPSWFRVLQVEPHLGRVLANEDSEQGNHQKVVISHALWQSYFAGDESVIGRDLTIYETPHTVVGVLPADFHVPLWETGIWTPITFDESFRSFNNRWDESTGLEMLARLRPGATIEMAREQIDALNAAFLEECPPDILHLIKQAGFHTRVESYRDDLIKEFRFPIMMLWGGVLFVLLIGSVNIANLLLVRTTARVKEFATRHALGAGRMRIVRQITTESLLLATIGGGLGLLVGSLSLKLLDAFAVYDIPRVVEVGMDLTATAFTFLLVVVVGTAAGVIPALRFLRGDLATVFLRGTRTITGEKRILSFQGALVSLQIAITFILLMGSGLMFASMKKVLAIDLGFDSEGVMANAVSLPWERYQDNNSRIRFIDSALEEIRVLPGVESAAIVNQLPFSEVDNQSVVTPEGYEREMDESVFTSYHSIVSPDYFDVMGIRLLRGRTFQPGDAMSDLPVVILDNWFVRRYWPEEDPIGKRVAFTALPDEDTTWYTVVGVVESIKQNSYVESNPTGAVYRLHTQSGLMFFRFVIKTGNEPLSNASVVREAIRRVDPGITAFWTVSLENDLTASLIPRRIPMQLLIAFAVVALLLAALGVYGVLAYSVNQRTQEIGIRIALGSTTGRIVKQVGVQWGKMVVIGLAAGLLGAFLLTQLIESLLYEVTPTDPVVFLVVLLILGSIALSACLLPAWRATTVNPVKALNTE